MANQEHLDLLKQGVKTWNAWRRAAHQIKPDLEEADLEDIDLSNILLHDASLKGARLSDVSLFQAYLQGADLSGATLRDINLRQSILQSAHLYKTDLADADLRQANLISARLNEANLSGTNLEKANLWRADCTQANLEQTRCDFASLNEARLNGARLTKASLWRARLDRASLAEADLTGAYLREADLSETTLVGADFSKALLLRTIFGNVDLSEAKGLETTWHAGRSYIDLHTLFRSQGKIPESFLKGIGASERSIESAQVPQGAAFPDVSCFLVYGSDDQDFAEQLHADLQHAGVHCWLACPDHRDDQGMRYHGSQSNRSLRKEAMCPQDKVLLVLSQRALGSVSLDVPRALEQEYQSNVQTIALRLDQTQWEHIPDQEWLERALRMKLGRTLTPLQQHPILDFATWKNRESYQRAFQHLLHMLREGPSQANR